MAERVGFEPTERLHARRFSRPVHSTTLSPLQRCQYVTNNSQQAVCVGNAIFLSVLQAHFYGNCIFFINKKRPDNQSGLLAYYIVKIGYLAPYSTLILKLN